MFEQYIDYRRAVIEILKSRKQAEVKLENTRADYADVCQTLDGVAAAGSGSGGRGGGEAVFVKKIERKEVLERKIRSLEVEENCIRRALDALHPDERTVLKVLYTVEYEEGKDAVPAACEAVHCERTRVYKLRDSGIKKMKWMLFE